MALANQEAQRFNHEYIGTEHILLGLVKEGGGVGANVLKNLDLDLRKIRLEVEKLVKHRKLIIPGYVAVMSGKLEEATHWEIMVGPRESSMIPKYLQEVA